MKPNGKNDPGGKCYLAAKSESDRVGSQRLLEAMNAFAQAKIELRSAGVSFYSGNVFWWPWVAEEPIRQEGWVLDGIMIAEKPVNGEFPVSATISFRVRNGGVSQVLVRKSGIPLSGIRYWVGQMQQAIEALS